MKSRLELITKEEREIILKNLGNWNGNKPFDLIDVLSRIDKRIEEIYRSGNGNNKDYRQAGIIFEHFGWYLGNLPFELEAKLALYRGLPKEISERKIREMFK
ncbi:MAG: hypothetical protein N3D20_01075 [Candidatus Pacearchaeota archaeon]|nr:hypothetical protein [Candidatus Pacearchaeota archaeon]